jgi:hypothetical protein
MTILATSPRLQTVAATPQASPVLHPIVCILLGVFAALEAPLASLACHAAKALMSCAFGWVEFVMKLRHLLVIGRNEGVVLSAVMAAVVKMP